MSKNKSIVIINDFAYVNGGAGEVAISSAKELAVRGHNVTLFAAVGPIDETLKDSGVNVICLNQEYIVEDPNPVKAAIRGIWNRNAFYELKDLLKSLNSEQTIVHLHAWTKALSASIGKAIQDTDVSAVASLHEYFLACPNGSFFNYQQNKICKLTPMSKECVRCNCDKQSYFHKMWRLARHKVQSEFGGMPSFLNHFIKISDFSYNILKPYLPDGVGIHKVNNPINVPMGKSVNPVANEIFTQVGRIDFQKGPHLLAKAADRLNVPARFVGDGQLREKIENQFKNVHITGWVSKAQVIDYLKESRALVFPSLWYETQGLVVLEAAAVGVPSIVPDTSAASDMVDDGETGLLFESGNVDDLIRKINLYKDDQLLSEMGNAAYEKYWEDPFTLDRHVNELEKVYNAIV